MCVELFATRISNCLGTSTSKRNYEKKLCLYFRRGPDALCFSVIRGTSHQRSKQARPRRRRGFQEPRVGESGRLASQGNGSRPQIRVKSRCRFSTTCVRRGD